jgi:hypothetical protein
MARCSYFLWGSAAALLILIIFTAYTDLMAKSVLTDAVGGYSRQAEKTVQLAQKKDAGSSSSGGGTSGGGSGTTGKRATVSDPIAVWLYSLFADPEYKKARKKWPRASSGDTKN